MLYFVLYFCFTVKVRPRVLVPRPKELPSEYHSSTKKQDIRWFSTRPFHPNSKWQFTTFQGYAYHRSSASLRHNYCWLGQARWSQSCDLIGSLGQTCYFGVAHFIPAKSVILLWNLAMQYLISWQSLCVRCLGICIYTVWKIMQMYDQSALRIWEKW